MVQRSHWYSHRTHRDCHHCTLCAGAEHIPPPPTCAGITLRTYVPDVSTACSLRNMRQAAPAAQQPSLHPPPPGNRRRPNNKLAPGGHWDYRRTLTQHDSKHGVLPAQWKPPALPSHAALQTSPRGWDGTTYLTPQEERVPPHCTASAYPMPVQDTAPIPPLRAASMPHLLKTVWNWRWP